MKLTCLTAAASAAALLWCGACPASDASEDPAAAGEPGFTAQQLRDDAYVMYDALRTLHPGLFRYRTPGEFDRDYQSLRAQLAGGGGLAQAYLDFARFAASIRCGHTWLNPLNQPGAVSHGVLGRADRLPLHFVVVGRRLLVTATVPGVGVAPGEEILAIDGVTVDGVIGRLWPYLRADGAADGKRLAQIGHGTSASAFDQYYGLLEPPRGSSRTLKVRTPGGPTRTVRVPSPGKLRARRCSRPAAAPLRRSGATFATAIPASSSCLPGRSGTASSTGRIGWRPRSLTCARPACAI